MESPCGLWLRPFWIVFLFSPVLRKGCSRYHWKRLFRAWFTRWHAWAGDGVGSGERAIAGLGSARESASWSRILSVERLPVGEVLAAGVTPVVVLRVGGLLFIFGPGFSVVVVPFPLEASFGLAVIDEVSLDWGLVRGVPISCV